MKDESPVEAVRRVLKSQFNIESSNVQAMMLIDAVQQASPPHPDATIASLRAILRSLSPDNGLESWAYRCAREITTYLAKEAEIRKIATRAHEGFWCHIEGTLTGMLLRMTRGLDLNDTQCPDCRGAGSIGDPANQCIRCNGEGKVEIPYTYLLNVSPHTHKTLHNLLNMLVEGKDNTREFLSMASQHTDLDVPVYDEVVALFKAISSKES